MKKYLIPLLMLIVLLAGCGNGETASGEAEEANVIDLAHSLSDADTTPHHAFAKYFKEFVEEKSNGEITVKIHPNGVLGAERDIIEGTELGTVDAAISSTAPLGNFSKLPEILEFPYLYEDGDHVFEVLNGDVGQEINESIERDGKLKVLSWFEVGPGGYSNSVRPIKHPDDLKGLKVRAVENEIKQGLERAFGAEPTPMAFTEVFSALQQGVVEGQGNPITVTVPNRFHEAQDYISLTGHYIQTGLLVMNPAVFNSYTEEQQELIMESAFEAQQAEREWLVDIEEQLIQGAIDAGVEVTTRDEIDLDAFREKAEAFNATYEDKYGEYFERIKALRE